MRCRLCPPPMPAACARRLRAPLFGFYAGINACIFGLFRPLSSAIIPLAVSFLLYPHSSPHRQPWPAVPGEGAEAGVEAGDEAGALAVEGRRRRACRTSAASSSSHTYWAIHWRSRYIVSMEFEFVTLNIWMQLFDLLVSFLAEAPEEVRRHA